MNRVARMLAVTGLGVFGGLALMAGPAQAASAGAAGPAKPATASAKADWGHDRIVGFYNSYGRCDSVGDRGEDRGRWEDHDCNRVRFGPHRGDFALSVDYGWRGHGGHGFPGHGHGFPGHGHGFPGHGHGFPGHGHSFPGGHGGHGHGPHFPR